MSKEVLVGLDTRVTTEWSTQVKTPRILCSLSQAIAQGTIDMSNISNGRAELSHNARSTQSILHGDTSQLNHNARSTQTLSLGDSKATTTQAPSSISVLASNIGNFYPNPTTVVVCSIFFFINLLN